MTTKKRNHQPDFIEAVEFERSLLLLLQAKKLAADVNRTVWDFATEITRLVEIGLSENEMRWLVCKKFVEHREDITQLRDTHRRFRAEHDMSFSKKSCFVLTHAGLKVAEEILSRCMDTSIGSSDLLSNPINGTLKLDANVELLPHWDGDRHELTLNDCLVKRFKWPANNQETVLMAFEEDGWPPRIDDPLPPQPDQDSKRRLHDTIKCLNRNQVNHAMSFHGDGTGQGVLWALTKEFACNGFSR